MLTVARAEVRPTVSLPLSPRAAYRRLASDSESLLLDLRSLPEWQLVGVPDLRALGKTPIFLSWQAYPDMAVQPAFGTALLSEGVGPDTPLYLLCRTGDRAPVAAQALATSGFTALHPIADGFEGPPDQQGRRGRLAGWKAEGLPWVQQ